MARTGGARAGPRLRRVVALASVAAAFAGVLGLVVPAPAPAAAATPTLRVLVTNDDGYSAPGINTVVQALRTLPRTEVTVVAPYSQESGQGDKTTPGRLTVTRAKTLAGYPAIGVHGYPVDTITWAVTRHNVRRPNLVVSGINFGENIGPLANVSGTVGAARAAYEAGIPAIAASQGVDDGSEPQYPVAAKYVVQWVTAHRRAILAASRARRLGQSGRPGRALPATNLNAPNCPSGTSVRGPVRVAQATSLGSVGTVTCRSAVTRPKTDVVGFVNGFVTLGPLLPPGPRPEARGPRH